MRLQDVTPGQRVLYRAHPDADVERGRVTSVTASWAFVRYDNDTHSKATPADMLRPAQSENTTAKEARR